LSTFQDAETAFRRRGAPFTFDAEAFVELVNTLKAAPVTTHTEPEISLFAPGFDHATKDPIQNAISVSSRVRVVIVEGNYTLLDQSPWRDVAESCAEKYVPSDSVIDTSIDSCQVVCRYPGRFGKTSHCETPSGSWY
jgi:pantothenate kinase